MTVQNGTQRHIDGEELRDKQVPHLALDTLDEVIEQVCDGLEARLSSDPEPLRSLTSSPHFRLAGENAGWYCALSVENLNRTQRK